MVYEQQLPGLSELILQVFPTVPNSGKSPISDQNKNAVSCFIEEKDPIPHLSQSYVDACAFSHHLFLSFV